MYVAATIWPLDCIIKRPWKFSEWELIQLLSLALTIYNCIIVQVAYDNTLFWEQGPLNTVGFASE